jgi:modulator of FtsH protease
MGGSEGWRDFFTTAAGAAAALAGLIFVSLSVNIAQILKWEHLPDRAAATLASLMLILAVSLTTLIPQPVLALGLETLVFGLAVWQLQVRAGLAALRSGQAHGRPRLESMGELITGQVQTLPFLVGGGMLAAGAEGAVYWLAAGTLLIFVLSVVNAWVLLVEILR